MTKANNVTALVQDISHLEKTVADLAVQVQRMQKLVRVDEREAAVAEKQSQTELLRVVAKNTDVANELLQELQQPTDQQGNIFFYAQRERRHRMAKQHLQQIHKLAASKQELTPQCPCGQHKGIRFFDEQGQMIMDLCPLVWWISQSHLAYTEGKLGQFVGGTPLEIYMRPYKLKKNTL